MQTVLFLIQTEGRMPEEYTCLKHYPHVLLSFKESTPDTHIHAPSTTWATGRNRLYQYVRDKQLDQYHYYIFMDDDLTFSGRSFERGISDFLFLLQKLPEDFDICAPRKITHSPFYFEKIFYITLRTLGITPPLRRKRLFRKRFLQGLLPGSYNENYYLDGALNAFSNQAFWTGHLLPYISRFDTYSWWLSQMILWFKIQHYGYRVLQYNYLIYDSTASSNYSRGYAQSKEALQYVATEELGIRSFTPKEIKPVKQSILPRYMLITHYLCYLKERIKMYDRADFIILKNHLTNTVRRIK